jgi:hypothetical protein
MAVVIDEAFRESLVGLEPEKYLSNAQIIWFVVGYDLIGDRWVLSPRQTVYTRLEPFRKSVDWRDPLSKEGFEDQLRKKLPSHLQSVTC